MIFSLGSQVNPSKVFIEQKSNVNGRLDPFYYRPELVALEKQVRKVTALRLRDFVVRMAGGATPSTAEPEKHYAESGEGVPFIRVQNLSTSGLLNLCDCKYITRSTHETLLKRSRLSGGELLVKITGVGRMAVASVVPESFEGNINQHMVAIGTKDIGTSETLAAYLNLDIAEQLASRRSTGGTRPALDYPALLSIPIVYDERIPKLMMAAIEKQQERIKEAGALLSSIDDVLLDELGIPQAPEIPDRLESRIFNSGFANLSGQRWDPLYYQADIFAFVRKAKCGFQRLGAVGNYFLTGFAAGRSDQGDEEDGGIIQIRPTNLSDDRELVFKRNIYIAATELKAHKSDVLKRGEVLFNNTNSQEQVGKTVWFDLEGDYFSSNHITRIGTKPGELDPCYLASILNLYQRRKVFSSSVQTGITNLALGQTSSSAFQFLCQRSHGKLKLRSTLKRSVLKHDLCVNKPAPNSRRPSATSKPLSLARMAASEAQRHSRLFPWELSLSAWFCPDGRTAGHLGSA
jgi:type I restriction enzyme, S subunit